MKSKISATESGLIWFGAAVSIAEILTGTLIAPLGFKNGIVAVLLGHLIGCSMLYLAGVIGGNAEKNSMESVKTSFGSRGAVLFPVLNVLQLVGWTAVMVQSGAQAAGEIFLKGNEWVWCVAIGALIVVWILIGIKNLGKVNYVAITAMFVVTVIISIKLFGSHVSTVSQTETISFGAAVELSAAMPISWLPLISDYTSQAKNGKMSSAISSVVYFFVSSWMFVIGMAIYLLTPYSTLSEMLLHSGLGVPGLIIIVFSTVTTTFMDAFSAGVSATGICSRLNGKVFGIFTAIAGTVLAIFVPMSAFEDFLYLIGSVFVPMISVQIADFIMKKSSKSRFNLRNLIIWLIGFATYRVFMKFDIIIGNTLPIVVLIILICIVTEKLSLYIGGNKNVG